MGWVKKLAPEHYCRKPRITKRVGAGSVWRCDECGQEWVVHNNYLFLRASHATRLTENS